MEVFVVNWLGEDFTDINSVHRTFNGAKKRVEEHADRLNMSLTLDNQEDGIWAYYVSKESDVSIQAMEIED